MFYPHVKEQRKTTRVSRQAFRALGFMTHLLLIFAVLSFAACARRSSHMEAIRVTPWPTASPAFKTYSINAAFAPDGPAITRKQRSWIRRVIHSKAYGPLRSRLRFADVPGVKTPIVVYVDRASPGQTDRGGHVLGESCYIMFDPYEHGEFPGTGASCAPPTPKPVE